MNDTDLFPVLSTNKRYTLEKSPEGYLIRDNITQAQVIMPESDLAQLYPDMSDAVDEYGDSVPMVGVPTAYLTSDTHDFERALCQDFRHSSERFAMHYFGLMKGCGLERTVSWVELEALFD